ncbi:Na(+)-translocating NADH-quinone reductase subunit F-like [Ylistrum balloti]|uniref:Na(+)-translocating NADH-quinone reductase subunit F-like n=1 Tax=Ylistrum balloti TaxID=509963 RepID=UPI002905D2AE|nr:Na(+)-translocating NADH-quinone reductase subunit F-like [Ylistrum balloti]
MYILAPLVLGIVSAVLAALIDISDKVLNNYGTCKINVNNGDKELSVKGGSPLLLTLAEQKIFVPSACGGKGTCGACKLQMPNNTDPVLPTELPFFNKEELANKTRLACQVKVKKDIDIAIPEELFNVQKLESTVSSIVDVTYDIKEVRLSISENLNSFKPGQYMQFETPKYKHNKKTFDTTFRAYSLASSRGSKNELEFLIRLVPGGVVTTYTHEYLKVDQAINVIGPFGDFYVRDTKNTMICVAGGSGMAPFRCIFRTMLEQNTFTEREIWYFFGAKAIRDMYYMSWLYDLEKKYKNFHFVPALSEPQPEDNWNGPVGLITEVLDKYLKKDIDRTNTLEGYLCGSPGMLDACMAVMGKNDMKEENIFFDKFA